MTNNYNDFKNGFKRDVKETGAGLIMIGGILLLAIVLIGAITFAIKDTKTNSSTRYLVGIIATAISFLIIFSKTARTRIVQFWIVGLVAIPLLFLLFIIICAFYIAFTQSFK